jgi:hypothetical protein
MWYNNGVMDKICEVCQISFYVKPSHAKGRFCCSRACQHKRVSMKGTEQRICVYCKLSFTCQKSAKKVYCSRKCVNNAESQRPDKSLLETLYLTERKTTRQIGKVLNVDKISIIRWLDFYGIPLRAAGRGLANRGFEQPSKTELIYLVHTLNLSYREIGERFGVDYTAIPHWLAKHNIPRPNGLVTRKKGNFRFPTKDELENLYIKQKLSTRRIGKMFNLGGGAIARKLREFNILVRESGWNTERLICIDGHVVKSSYELTVCDWLHENNIPHEYEPILENEFKFCPDFLAKGFYIEVWGVTSKAYKERKERKKKFYKKIGASLIELPVHSFSTKHNQLWKRILEKHLLCLQNRLF